MTGFLRFVATLHGAFSVPLLCTWGKSTVWTARLSAALKLPLSETPLEDDKWQRSALDLLHHLAHDGNRLVRWVAQTRIADPDFVFTWSEDE